MIDIQITINLTADDPTQLGTQLAAIIQGAHALANIEIEPTPKNGTESVETDVRHGIMHATGETPKEAPATSTTQRKSRGRPRKLAGDLVEPSADWDAFDALVRDEMKRLCIDGRIPSTAIWNNNRDVRLPTMAGVLQAYDVLNVLTLAAKLEMRPPYSELGVEPFVTANEEARV
ncbi:MAG: hypothetical protein R2932_59160 [Caldilineaceae bacterium]